MTHILNIYEVLEINELLSFKTSSLIKSELFLETVKGHKRAWFLEDDIKLSTEEITDLKNLLVLSAN